MHAAEQSDIGVVPEKEPNKVALWHGGGSGGKADDQGEILAKSSATCTQRQGQTLDGLDRVRAAAVISCFA